ncbi:MAG: diacylglycerol kinase [Proteobacteria bacterium]|nr:diacylglycerol kinase [Pseudomonadota bacterium]
MNKHRNQPLHTRFAFALQGLGYALRTQRSLQTEVVALLGVVAVLLATRPEPLWWALLLLSSSAVLAAELLNTAVEQLADELHPGRSPGIGIVKDCAAAAVLLTVLGAIAVGIAFLVHLLVH